MVNIGKITKGLVATTLSLGLLTSMGNQVFADDLPPEEVKSIATMKKIQKETKKMNAKQKQAYYNKVVNGIVKEAKKEKTVVGQIKVIHDRLASRITYDDAVTEDPKNYNEEGYTAFGAIVNGKAVCDGYTRVFRDALTKAGIINKYIADDKLNHAWNLVKIDGKFYHIDLTWDDGNNLPYYRHFLVDDATLQLSHETYKPTSKSKATSKKYLNFSKSDYPWDSLVSDNKGIVFQDKIGIHKVDVTGKLTTLVKYTDETFLYGVNDSDMYLMTETLKYKPNGEEYFESTLFSFSKETNSKKKIIFKDKDKDSFQTKITVDYVEITYSIDGVENIVKFNWL